MAKVRPSDLFLRPLNLFLLWEEATYRSSTTRNLVNAVNKSIKKTKFFSTLQKLWLHPYLFQTVRPAMKNSFQIWPMIKKSLVTLVYTRVGSTFLIAGKNLNIKFNWVLENKILKITDKIITISAREDKIFLQLCHFIYKWEKIWSMTKGLRAAVCPWLSYNDGHVVNVVNEL